MATFRSPFCQSITIMLKTNSHHLIHPNQQRVTCLDLEKERSNLFIKFEVLQLENYQKIIDPNCSSKLYY